MKNRCVRKRNHHSRLSIDFFSEPVRHNQSAESILAGFSLILNGLLNGRQETHFLLMVEQLSAKDFIQSLLFSNSLIIHQVKTKKIISVKGVWIPGLN